VTDYILEDRRTIDRAHLSDMLASDPGVPTLQIKVHYSKDERRRGLKLSVFRCLIDDRSQTYDIMNAHNGRVHLADFARKPSPKVAAQWAAHVAAHLDTIAALALSSAKPDWATLPGLVGAP